MKAYLEEEKQKMVLKDKQIIYFIRKHLLQRHYFLKKIKHNEEKTLGNFFFKQVLVAHLSTKRIRRRGH